MIFQLPSRWMFATSVALLLMPRWIFAADPAASQPAAVVVDAVTRGVVGDGATLNTAAIQAAIDSISNQGGGVLMFPVGRYITGTIELKDNVRLRFSEQAVLLGSKNPADYRNLDPFQPGDYKATFGYALVTAVGASHVGIEGPGTIDGQGKAVKAAQKNYKIRPFLVRWEHCTDVTVKEIHLTDPGAWTMQFFQCRNVVADHVTIRSADSHLINNDGIDIDSSRQVAITDCDIDSGDDAICVKTTSPQASSDLTITGCSLKTRCNGIKLGTESLGDYSNIRASHCRMRDIGMAGVALYAVDGADMRDVIFTDLDMEGVTVPISMRLGSRLKTFRPGDQPRPIGSLRDISLSNIRAVGAKQIGLLINGIPDHPIEGLHLKNIDITLAGGGAAKDADIQLAEKESTYPEMNMFGKTMPAFGVYLRHVNNVSCDHVKLSTTRPDERPAVKLVDVHGVKPEDFVTIPQH